MSLQEESSNANTGEAWNTVLFQKYCRFKHAITTGLGVHGRAAFERHPPRAGSRVIDLGCSFGDMTTLLARAVGEAGEAVGVDMAKRFIAAARQDAAAMSVSNARFFVGDIQTTDLGGPFDHAFSRFGTMFCANPVQALRNVRRALVPGGTLCMVVWRKREDNPYIHVPERVVERILPKVDRAGALTCGPGPFSMENPDLVSDLLRKAGYERPTFERFDAPICIGRTLDEAIEFALELGPAGEIVRLAGDDGRRLRPEVVRGLREALRAFAGGDGAVIAPSSVWIVTAVAGSQA
jgi:ubiquinone/menaquinone biosynthesis C-methylase UbiE